MKKIAQTLLFIFCLLPSAYAQTIRSVLDAQLKVKKVKGVYDRSKKTFYSKSIDSANVYVEHKYKVEKYLGNTGVIKYTYTNTQNNETRHLDAYGVIDTSGNVIVPCIYNEIRSLYYVFHKGENGKDGYEEIFNFSYFIFEYNDSIGIVAANNRIVFQIPMKIIPTDDPKKKYDKNFISCMVDSAQHDIDYCRFSLDGNFGLFSLTQEKIVVPAKYKNIGIYDDYAICKENNKFTAYNCKTGIQSGKFDHLWRLNWNGPFLIQYPNRKYYACNDILDPAKTGNKEINNDSILEYKDHLLIVRLKDKCALLEESGKQLIPFIYDDIYFFDKEFVVVKQNGFWAIANHNNVLKSGFDFIDVDKQNMVNLKNFLHFSQTDTSAYAYSNASMEIKEYRYYSFTGLMYDMEVASRQLIKELNGHIISKYSSYVLKGKDGFHFIDISFYKDSLVINPMWWDNVFVVPGYSGQVGVQRGNKYGYYNSDKDIKQYLKYDNVRYIASLNLYDVNHSHSISAYCVVKRGIVRYKDTKWVPFSNRKERVRWKRDGRDKRTM